MSWVTETHPRFRRTPLLKNIAFTAATGTYNYEDGNIWTQIGFMTAFLTALIIAFVWLLSGPTYARRKASTHVIYAVSVGALLILGFVFLIGNLTVCAQQQDEFQQWAQDRYGITLSDETASVLRDVSTRDAGNPGGTVSIDGNAVILIHGEDGGYVLMGQDGTVELPTK